MNRIEAAWQALVASFEWDPWEGFERLDDVTEGQLAMLRVHDQMSASSIAALLEECETVAETAGFEAAPC